MIKHGHRTRKNRTKEYAAWSHLMQRCYNENHPAYKNYGGRGITVCDRWHKYENFLADVGLSPSNLHSVDRFPNNDGNYEPTNFRWATIEQQNNNKRSVKLINGKSAQQWSIEIGGNRGLVGKRLKNGWSEEDAISKLP